MKILAIATALFVVAAPAQANYWATNDTVPSYAGRVVVPSSAVTGRVPSAPAGSRWSETSSTITATVNGGETVRCAKEVTRTGSRQLLTVIYQCGKFTVTHEIDTSFTSLKLYGLDNHLSYTLIDSKGQQFGFLSPKTTESHSCINSDRCVEISQTMLQSDVVNLVLTRTTEKVLTTAPRPVF
jgi:hypothetical protein